MRSDAGAIVGSTKRFIALCLCSALVAIVGTFSSVSAESTDVQVSVNSGVLHPALTLTGVSSPLVVHDLPLNLEGSVSSLTQIQVYVDDVFSVTIPLDEGATTFSHSLVVSPGAHTVKLVGISPFVDITPTATLQVVYTASAVTTGRVEDSEHGGAIISREASSETPATRLQAPQATSLPSWLYDGLLALDIARPDDTDGQELAKMAQRFSLASAGMFFVIFANPALLFFQQVSGAWFGLKKLSMPSFIRARPLLYIRLAGLSLVGVVFAFT